MTTRACTIDGCPRPHKGRGYCKLHLQRVWRQGDPLRVGVPQHHTGEEHPNWTGDTISYRGAHLRVAYQRGRAAQRLCSTGCGRPAAEWAYDHQDPNELHRDDGRPFSANPAHYTPMCRPCHRRFDAGRAAA